MSNSDDLNNIYWQEFEVRALVGSQMFGEAIGGFGSACTPAESPEHAHELICAQLVEDCYEIVELGTPYLFEELEWESVESAQELGAVAKDAKTTGDVCYSTFHVYESDTDYEH